jgi:hypothetical protein
MDEVEEASQLIGDIYDAALDPSLWPHVLERTCGYIGGLAAGLLSQDSVHKNATFHFVWGDDAHYTQLYNETYSKINPTTLATLLQARAGEVIALSDVIPIEEYLSSRFYKEWVQPQRYLDGIQATLEKSATTYAAVIVPLHESRGWVDYETRHRMLLLWSTYIRSNPRRSPTRSTGWRQRCFWLTPTLALSTPMRAGTRCSPRAMCCTGTAASCTRLMRRPIRRCGMYSQQREPAT